MAIDVAVAEAPRRKSSSDKASSRRANSLRKTKNLAERQRERERERGAKLRKELGLEPPSPPPEGKSSKLTTTNGSGGNGMIFLRSVQQPAKSKEPKGAGRTISAQSSRSSETSSGGVSKDRPKFRSGLFAGTTSALARPGTNARTAMNRPQRSFSHSTADDVRLANERLEEGAVKIVLNKASTHDVRINIGDLDGEEEYPNLRVSIPNYRLGTPRFSARGTAFFHQSTYANSSIHNELPDGDTSSLFSGGEYDRGFPRSLGIEAQAVLSRRHSHASPQPYSLQTAHGPSFYTTIAPNAYTLPTSSGPISPHIYDELAVNPHNPKLVKYSPINGDILAASPARIVAQITSENFLDYELLSDFFLTVRSYLTTHDLLSYLLARFEWAINRFDDNGRVIRVRAFAALRHWILNYFSYDFVVDRDLRVQFCDRLNNLTKIVKARADYGASDMKLIADLKKCWNGRCMLFWDHPNYVIDGQQDMDIQPGGVVGSRNSMLVNQSQLRFHPVAPQPPALNPAQLTAGTTSLANWYTSVMEHGANQSKGHNRQTSTATSRSLPLSPTSEISMPALSCSIPARSFRRAFPYSTRALGLHPIPTDPQGQQIYAPAASGQAGDLITSAAANRRSGSFSDAVRDRREPLSSEQPEAMDELMLAYSYQELSLLRGHGIVPGSPVVRPIPVASEGSRSARSSGNGRDRELDPSVRKSTSAQNPAVKSIIGNIKRALSSKHTTLPPPTTSRAVGPSGVSAPTLAVGRSAQVPLNVLYQASSTGHLEPFKSATRIDLLAEKIYHTYRDAYSRPIDLSYNNTETIGVAMGNESQQPSPFNDDENRPSYGLSEHLQPPGLKRYHSAVTDGSQSIVIMDDTGAPNHPMFASANPAMALINTIQTSELAAEQPQELSATSNHPDDGSSEHEDEKEVTTPTGNNAAVDHGAWPVQSEGHVDESTELPPIRPPLQRHNSGSRATQASSISLRRYASFQSTFSKHGHNMSIDTGLAGPNDRVSSVIKEAPTRALRRRPGGDLRANNNVNDLQERMRPKSAGSITTYSESVRGSDLYGYGDKLIRTVDGSRPSFRPDTPVDGAEAPAESRHSMIRTHSSMPEKRRPSFEAAVAQFARIPDEDDGGIEVALLKLEGKYKSPLQSPLPLSMQPPPRPSNPEPPCTSDHDSVEGPRAKPSNGKLNLEDELAAAAGDLVGSQTVAHDHQLAGPGGTPDNRGPVASTLYAGSEDSYNSVPLLARHDDEDEGAPRAEASVVDVNAGDFPGQFQGEFHGTHPLTEEYLRQQPSMMRSLRYGSIAPTATTDSFLLDEEDDFLSDLSSDVSADTIEAPDNNGNLEARVQDDERYPPDMVTLGREHPPSPPMTKENAMQISTQAHAAHEERKPPTPDPSPVTQPAVPDHGGGGSRSDPNEPQHMPFVLGFETEAIVQQLTLLEKDALREVDWRDLVDMRWQTTATTTTNWVDFLLTRDPLGVDLVTARFNIVVKWALSEIVLTENIEERAVVIMKYIHMAHTARRLHNYATLLQLTIALTSADCNRLGRTWNLVPEREKDMLQDLELLVSPKKNFFNLRVEMEKANSDQGCIPVVALYLHDLTYNAQKPGYVPAGGDGDGEPLVNFERYRSTAVIVKSLLRLIDASTKYDYQPAPGLIDRCLWMAALPDEAISYKSKKLEWGTNT